MQQLRLQKWNHSIVAPRRSLVPTASRAAACLLATIAVSGCTSSVGRARDDASSSSSTPVHGSLTDVQFNVAVAVARAEIANYEATVTSASVQTGSTAPDPGATVLFTH
jgi:hypothetical protein